MFKGLILVAGPPTQPPPQNTQGAVVGSSVLDTPKEVVSVGASFDELIEQVFLAKKESKAEESGLSSSLKQEDKENSGLRFFF